jgi:cytochrome P450
MEISSLQTAATLLCAILAMVLYPDAQRKAQAELDEHFDPGQLPTLADRPELPYVNAFVLEVMRWFPVVPLGMCGGNICCYLTRQD